MACLTLRKLTLYGQEKKKTLVLVFQASNSDLIGTAACTFVIVLGK